MSTINICNLVGQESKSIRFELHSGVGPRSFEWLLLLPFTITYIQFQIILNLMMNIEQLNFKILKIQIMNELYLCKKVKSPSSLGKQVG